MIVYPFPGMKVSWKSNAQGVKGQWIVGEVQTSVERFIAPPMLIAPDPSELIAPLKTQVRVMVKPYVVRAIGNGQGVRSLGRSVWVNLESLRKPTQNHLY